MSRVMGFVGPGQNIEPTNPASCSVHEVMLQRKAKIQPRDNGSGQAICRVGGGEITRDQNNT